MTAVYHNEHDRQAAQWLRNLADAGEIPAGLVDERDIQEVTPDEVRGYRQCHFFAGVGGWSLALRLAGWDPAHPVWTASCPCQPFSQAGDRKAEADHRHLWPVLRKLVATCKPPTIFGEQVSSDLGRRWLTDVQFDLENIECWRWFYENLHEVQSESAEGRLPQILWSILGRIEAHLQGMPKGVRGCLENSQSPKACGDEEAEIREGENLSADLRLQEQGPSSRERSDSSREEKGHSLRPPTPFLRDRNSRPSRHMRDDRSSVQHAQRRHQLGFAFIGQDPAEGRLRLLEHSRCLFCDELCDGELGRGNTSYDHICMAGKEIANDELLLAGAFGKLLASNLGREWIARVRADLEALGYEVGAADLCAAGVGSPHIRQRL